MPAPAITLRVGLAALLLAFGLTVVSQGQPPTTAPAAVDQAAPAPLWTQWRGPTRDGMLPGADWPENLKGLQQVWSTDLAEGYPGPLVTTDHVYTIETRDSQFEVARCLRRSDGSLVWELSWAGAMQVPFFAVRNGSWVRSTPAIADGRIFLPGMRDVLVCADAATGKELWRVDFTQRYKTPLPTFGFVSSPLVVGNRLYVQAGGAVVCMDARTGDPVWRSFEDGGGMMGSAFASPVLQELAGRSQLLVQSRAELAGLDPDTGSVLWRVPIRSFRGMNILTPQVAGDGLLFTSSYGGGSFGVQVRQDKPPAGDGSGPAAAPEQWTAATKWTNRWQGYMCSPVVVDGHAYLLGRDKRYACIELATGEIKWQTRETFSEYSSMVSNGRLILALDSLGELMLLRANTQKFDLLDRRRLSDRETWAHLAVVGDELFVRDLRGITLWRWHHAEPSSPAAATRPSP